MESPSRSATTKLWLPPVSSNGLKRTMPTRWTMCRASPSMQPQAAGLGHHLVTDPVEPLHLRCEQLVEDGVSGEGRSSLAGATTPTAQGEGQRDQRHHHGDQGQQASHLAERIDRRLHRWGDLVWGAAGRPTPHGTRADDASKRSYRAPMLSFPTGRIRHAGARRHT